MLYYSKPFKKEANSLKYSNGNGMKTKKLMTFNVPKETYEALRKAAFYSRRTMTEIVFNKSLERKLNRYIEERQQ
jgi:hypothetical protein